MAGEADELPPNHVTVAAVGRFPQDSFQGMLPQGFEEFGCLFEFRNLIGLKVCKYRVSISFGNTPKTQTEPVLGMTVKGAATFAIKSCQLWVCLGKQALHIVDDAGLNCSRRRCGGDDAGRRRL